MELLQFKASVTRACIRRIWGGGYFTKKLTQRVADLDNLPGFHDVTITSVFGRSTERVRVAHQTRNCAGSGFQVKHGVWGATPRVRRPRSSASGRDGISAGSSAVQIGPTPQPHPLGHPLDRGLDERQGEEGLAAVRRGGRGFPLGRR